MTKKTLIAMTALISLISGSTNPAAAESDSSAHRPISVWSPSMTIGGPNFTDQTLRMVVHPSVGGDALRVHLSNLRGATPPAVGSVSLALQARPGAGRDALGLHPSNLRATTPRAAGSVTLAPQPGRRTAVAGPQRQVTFSHAKTLTTPAGREVVSDPVPLPVRAEQNLLVSLYLPQA